jgi:23S rRNA pseudouridine1911/1915/1917 synthase
MKARGRKSFVQYATSEETALPEPTTADGTVIEEVSLPVGARQDTERMDRFIARQIKFISRTRVQELIETGKVTVNGTPILKPSHRLSPGEDILVCIEREPRPVIRAEDIPLDIVYEDSDLMVINKPTGMVVHPSRGHFSGTLVNALMHHEKALPDEATEEFRPGIVHRLDRETTGLMVVGRTEEAVRRLSDMFFKRSVQRVYRAIVWTCPKAMQGTIRTDIGRDPRDRTKMTTLHEGRGRSAVTHYKTTARFDFLSLLEVKLETGRTHQIRVHFEHIGHPIFGDPAYSGRDYKRGGFVGDRVQRAKRYLDTIQRQALHSWRMGFEHPMTGERLEFEAPMPPDFAEVLDQEAQLVGYDPEPCSSSVWTWAEDLPQ